MAVAIAAPARADSAASPGTPPPAVVDCYDAASDTVSRVLFGECHGQIVSSAEAKAIAAKHERQLKQALGHTQFGAPNGLHLTSIGTGFYTDDQGHLLTNYHVVEGCGTLTVRIAGNDPIVAKILGFDEHLDLALLQADFEADASAEFPLEEDPVPDPYVAIVGYPDQGLPPLAPFLTPGVLLQDSANVEGTPHLVIHADLRHGNSGGPIFDRHGRVVGMINAKLDTARYFAATGETLTDLGLGIPRRALTDFLGRNNVSHETAGVDRTFDERQLLARAEHFVARVECWNGPSTPAGGDPAPTASSQPQSSSPTAP